MIKAALVIFSLFFASQTAANQTGLPSDVAGLREYLDVVNFDLEEKPDERLELLKTLVDHCEELVEEQPQDAGLTMMAGFFNAQYAGFKGGLGALKYAKAARDHLQTSVEVDPSIYQASGLAVLGSLFYQVPGWPVGFGNKKKAKQYLEQALELAPKGMDSNVTYAQFMFAEKEYELAKKHLIIASNAEPRPDRPKADVEVRKNIDKLLAEINKKLNDD